MREQPLLEQCRTGQLRKVPEHQVNIAAAQRGLQLLERQVHAAHIHAGRELRESVDQARHEHELTDIVHGEGDGSRGRRRIERRLLQQVGADTVEDGFQRRRHCFRVRRRMDAACGSDEEGIAEHPAQAIERGARRRLAHAQRASCR